MPVEPCRWRLCLTSTPITCALQCRERVSAIVAGQYQHPRPIEDVPVAGEQRLVALVIGFRCRWLLLPLFVLPVWVR